MSKLPKAVTCEVCGADGLGCRAITAGAWKCRGHGPIDPTRWQSRAPELPGGIRVYSPRLSKPPKPKPLAIGETAYAASETARSDDAEPPASFSPFPTDALPKPIAAYVREHAAAMGIDASMICLPILAALAAAIGNTRIVTIKRRWSEPATLWAALVMRSGEKKSPAMDAALDPIRLRQERLIAEHAAALEAHRDAQEQWERANKETRGRAPLPPTCVRYTVEDATMEAIALRMHENPRGLLMARDELAGLFGSFNQYRAKGAGADQANWLKFFHARSYTNDRKGDGGKLIYIPRANVSIVGTIQPAILQRVLTREYFESGLAARFLFCYPPSHVSKWTDAETDPATDEAMAVIFDRLLDIPLAVNAANVPEPFPVGMSRDAKALFVPFFNEHNAKLPTLNDDESAAWSKLEAYCPRLALVLHMANWACQESPGETGAIQAATMEAAIRVNRWFAAETLRVYAAIREAPEDREQRELVEWIRRNGGRVTARDVQRGPRRLRMTADAATVALSRLVAKGLGKLEFDPPGPDGGPGAQFFRLCGTG